MDIEQNCLSPTISDSVHFGVERFSVAIADLFVVVDCVLGGILHVMVGIEIEDCLRPGCHLCRSARHSVGVCTDGFEVGHRRQKVLLRSVGESISPVLSEREESKCASD